MNDLPTVGSLFAGIGGIDLAFEVAGFRTVWQVEIADFPRAVLTKHFPHAVQHRDIFECHDLPHVDVITAGFPCQPFSLAGKRMGINDERYLVPEMLRVIQEIQPYVVFLENVPGFASIADGDAFKQLLRALAEMGYDAQWGHLRASDTGAPHQRERWFCVAYRSHNGTDRWIGGTAYNAARSAGERIAGRNRSDGRLPHVDNANRQRRKQRHTITITNCKKQPTRRLDAQRRAWQPQPRLGGNAHGLPARLDGHTFPAPPGQPQYPAEPPRVQAGTPNRNARLKALGNAVVPQVVYPVAQAIRQWLAEADQEVAA